MQEIIEISESEDELQTVFRSRNISPLVASRPARQADPVLLLSDESDDELPELGALAPKRSHGAQPLPSKPLHRALNSSQSEIIDQFTSPLFSAPKARKTALPPRQRRRSDDGLGLDSPPRFTPSPSPPPIPSRSRSPANEDNYPTAQKRRIPAVSEVSGESTAAARKRQKQIDQEAQAALKAQQQAEKAVEKARKQMEKEEKKRSADVNKLRVSKWDTLREVKLCLASNLMSHPSPMAAVLPSLQEKFKENLSDIVQLKQGSFPGLIKFQRHVRAAFDPSRGLWVAVDPGKEKWMDEGMVGLFIQGEDLVEMIRAQVEERQTGVRAGATSTQTLDRWIRDVQFNLKDTSVPESHHPPEHCSPLCPRNTDGTPRVILIIHGLKSYYQKTTTQANREFAARARAAISEVDGTTDDFSGQSKGRRKKTTSDTRARLEKDVVEKELVRVHFKHDWLQVQVDTPSELTEWMTNMAADVAIRPYKLISKAHTLPLVRENNVKASSSQHALELMLEEVPGVTTSGSQGIAGEYKSFRQVMQGYTEIEETRGETRAMTMLENCTVKHLKTGVANERRVGVAVAKRVWKALRTAEPTAPV